MQWAAGSEVGIKAAMGEGDMHLANVAQGTDNWIQGKRGVLKPGQAMVLLPPNEEEDENSLAGYLAPLRQALIDDNEWHVNVIVCEGDYRALKRGIEHLTPGLQ